MDGGLRRSLSLFQLEFNARAYFRENGMAPDTTQETVAEYAARWLADHAGRVNSIPDDRGRMNHHVLPVLGPLDVTRFGRADVERLRDALDTKIADGTLSWKTAANCWTVITSMCSDMVSSKRRKLRARDDNATDKVRAPERGGNKAKQYLYPSEFLTFVSCEKIPIRWRRDDPLKIKQRCGHQTFRPPKSTSGRPRPSGKGLATSFLPYPARFWAPSGILVEFGQCQNSEAELA